MLAAWVRPELRDYVRARAEEQGVLVSEWVAEALRRAVVKQSVEKAMGMKP
jgi:predicted HicB family RNase H-like nuclease